MRPCSIVDSLTGSQGAMRMLAESHSAVYSLVVSDQWNPSVLTTVVCLGMFEHGIVKGIGKF